MSRREKGLDSTPGLGGRGDILVLALLATGLLLRLVVLWTRGEPQLRGDEGHYVQLAAIWARFDVYVGSDAYLWPPGYPLWLRAFMESFGEQALEAARLGQVALSLVIGGCVAFLAAAVGGRSTARVATALWAFYLPLVFFTHSLWPETLFLALYLPAVCLCWRALAGESSGERQVGELLVAGLLLGLATLVKQVAMVLPACLALALVLDPARAWGRRWGRPLVLLLAASVVVLPWVLRNVSVYGRFVPSGATLGENLSRGWNSDLVEFDYLEDLSGSRLQGSDWRRVFEGPSEEAWTRRRLPNLIDTDRHAVSQAFEFAARNPGYLMISRVQSAANLFTPLSFFDRHLRAGAYSGRTSRAAAALAVVSVVSTAAVLALAVPGFLLGLSGYAPRALFLAAIVPILAVAAMLNGLSRFRTPVEPLLLVLAAVALAALTGRRGSAERWPVSGRWARGGVIVGWMILAGLWWLNAPEISHELGRLW